MIYRESFLCREKSISRTAKLIPDGKFIISRYEWLFPEPKGKFSFSFIEKIKLYIELREEFIRQNITIFIFGNKFIYNLFKEIMKKKLVKNIFVTLKITKIVYTITNIKVLTHPFLIHIF